MLNKILNSLGFNEGEIRAYLQLLESGPSTVGALAKKMGMARPSLYGFLQRLHEKGIVTQTLKYGVKTFVAENPDQIERLFQRQIDSLERDRRRYIALLPQLQKRVAADASNPKFRLYEGVTGVKQVLYDLLLYRDIETLTFWPARAAIDILSGDFFHNHNLERIRNNISIRAIWPQKQVVSQDKYPSLGTGADFKREIRVAPPEIAFSMGYWLYGDTAAFVSSRRECFGFIIESAELVEMLTTQHALIWQISKPLKASDGTEAAKGFLKDV